MDSMEFSRALYDYMHRTNQNKQQVAKRLGITMNTLENWRLGVTKPHMKNEGKIRSVFGLPAQDLSVRVSLTNKQLVTIYPDNAETIDIFDSFSYVTFVFKEDKIYINLSTLQLPTSVKVTKASGSAHIKVSTAQSEIFRRVLRLGADREFSLETDEDGYYIAVPEKEPETALNEPTANPSKELMDVLYNILETNMQILDFLKGKETASESNGTSADVH